MALNMTTDGNGYIHLADDGVARSYSANGTVIDFRKLTNKQIWQHISKHQHQFNQNLTDHLTQVYANTSGFDVNDEQQIWNPPAELRVKAGNSTTTTGSLTSPNPSAEAEKALKDRAIGDCIGRLCTYQLWCVAQGCDGCIFMDEMTVGLCSA